jgi:hypothetical protein
VSRERADAVVVPTVARELYIVSMFGTVSDWVHNIEASPGDAVISHGASQRASRAGAAGGADARTPRVRAYRIERTQTLPTARWSAAGRFFCDG